ncbi:MAG: hypothetical protein HFJ60_08845 [Clostridia bacterium]|nr:hypothetical protein [Clostridia bacterium]
MKKDLQELINEAVQKSINKTIIDNINNPKFEFVATYDAESLTRYINR